MAQDESRDQGDDQGASDHEGQDAATPVAIATTDPVIDAVVEHQSDWKTHPDSTVSVETTQVTEPNPLYAPGVRTVVIESHSQHDSSGSSDEGRDHPEDRNKEESHDDDIGADQSQSRRDSQAKRYNNGDRNQKRGDQKGRPHDHDRVQDDDDQVDDRSRQNGRSQHHQPSMMKTMLLPAGVALLGGVIGAMGYSYFFGDKSGKSQSDHSQSKADSSSKGDSGSSDGSSSKGDSSSSSSKSDSDSGESKGSSKGTNSQAKNNAVSFNILHEEEKTLRWQALATSTPIKGEIWLDSFRNRALGSR